VDPGLQGSLQRPAPLRPCPKAAPPQLLQVVLGVLGCPNLPLAPITDQDCDEGQAARSFSDEAVGTMFAASKGQVGRWGRGGEGGGTGGLPPLAQAAPGAATGGPGCSAKPPARTASGL
jgi:hypothetical protein